MSKLEGGLIIIIFFLIAIISAMGCWAWQQKKNEELMFDRLTRQLVMQDAEIEELKRKQTVFQSDLCRTGVYDKK